MIAVFKGVAPAFFELAFGCDTLTCCLFEVVHPVIIPVNKGDWNIELSTSHLGRMPQGRHPAVQVDVEATCYRVFSRARSHVLLKVVVSKKVLGFLVIISTDLSHQGF